MFEERHPQHPVVVSVVRLLFGGGGWRRWWRRFLCLYDCQGLRWGIGVGVVAIRVVVNPINIVSMRVWCYLVGSGLGARFRYGRCLGRPLLTRSRRRRRGRRGGFFTRRRISPVVFQRHLLKARYDLTASDSGVLSG